ncbi:ArsR/SmtB family transcription factor [Foetidibacter luteolus]|uniref:ArsR/SmtB family transcription factor n=1 Tax=Foetidibacter luteolus TaxID=2608880 RepID=UPI00129B4411|nr:metalloregulator ArsR/SmtB family transcription factor [Foetidibacter luteolus]
MEIRRDVFQAIADPTRRQIIRMIAHQPLNLNAIAEKFDVTRQAVSLHVKILTECGLLVIKQQGRERICEARLDSLKEVATWVDECTAFWKSRFAQLEKHLDNEKTKTKNYDNR